MSLFEEFVCVCSVECFGCSWMKEGRELETQEGIYIPPPSPLPAPATI